MSDLYFTTPTITVERWRDDVVDQLGHEARSRYTELFWLSYLGPSSVWLLRHLTAKFDDNPDGYELELAGAAAAIGLGTTGGKHGAFMRSFARLSRFGMVRAMGTSELAVRLRIPPLNLSQVSRLTPELQREHNKWANAALRRSTADTNKARELALTLVEHGEGVDTVEQLLARCSYNPKLSSDAATWAWEANLHRLRHATPVE